MVKRYILRMFTGIAILIFLAGMIVIILPRLITFIHGLQRTYAVDTVPEHGAAIVFGAGLWRDGSPTPVLRDRVTTAAELFFSGKVSKLLMSGDNSTEFYDEPGAMRDYAIQIGVPEDAIVLDYAGRRTYDTCFRAREIFGIKEAILVTQNFHLPRALYTCSALGIDAVGVPSDLRNYRNRSLVYWNLREFPATLVAMLDVHVTQPTPILGEPEPIFPLEAH